jgi:hypothetical protein
MKVLASAAGVVVAGAGLGLMNYLSVGQVFHAQQKAGHKG